MINKIIFEGPVNNLSMGNVSVNLLKSLYNKKIDVLYLPIGNTDIGNFNLTEEFKQNLQNSANRFYKEFKRNIPTIKNWHLSNGGHLFPSDKRYLLTYHECNIATDEELNVVRNTNKTFFCGNYSPTIFKNCGVQNVDSFSLGFDADSFQKTDKVYFTDGRIQWLLTGKCEKRKKTLEVLTLWAKKYGKKQGEFYRTGEQQHFLNCAVLNSFYDAKIQEN